MCEFNGDGEGLGSAARARIRDGFFDKVYREDSVTVRVRLRVLCNGDGDFGV